MDPAQAAGPRPTPPELRERSFLVIELGFSEGTMVADPQAMCLATACHNLQPNEPNNLQHSEGEITY